MNKKYFSYLFSVVVLFVSVGSVAPMEKIYFGDGTCPVCHNFFEKVNDVDVYSCGHCFCGECSDKWRGASKDIVENVTESGSREMSCPLCRKEIVTESDYTNYSSKKFMRKCGFGFESLQELQMENGDSSMVMDKRKHEEEMLREKEKLDKEAGRNNKNKMILEEVRQIILELRNKALKERR